MSVVFCFLRCWCLLPYVLYSFDGVMCLVCFFCFFFALFAFVVFLMACLFLVLVRSISMFYIVVVVCCLTFVFLYLLDGFMCLVCVPFVRCFVVLLVFVVFL